ncbi:MAG: hypothetical protein EA358_00235 [Flavobacteriales bacterium]|nr:MAG: hypothetical protein EA358_00235 [Flavobacteriales bacterium]
MRQFLLSISLFLFLQAAAQENPRVGLVFSGGGARCIAQLGVYQVMEEEGVRIDHIGGTSMGAIIGGLLSMGYNSGEVLKLLREVDWERLQNDQIPRERLSYADKKRRERYVTRLDIRNWRVQLPQGLNSGHYVLKNLNFLFQQAGNISDFTALPIPFYCVATNLENGKPIAFEGGDLSLALRASSAFPSIFFPIEIDGNLYVDGGVMDNFPVAFMRKKDVDILIGVDVQNPSYTKDELTNAFRVLEQISTLNNYFSNLSSDSLVDVLIRLELEKIGLFDFQKFQELLNIGYQYGEMYREAFREIAQRQKGRDNVVALPLPANNFQISDCHIEGTLAKSHKFYFRELGLQKNQTLNTKKLNRKIDEWMGSLRYSQIRYNVIPDTGEAYKLHLQINSDTVLNRIGASIRYDDDFGAGVLLNYERRDLFFSNAHFNIDLVVSENPRTWIEYSTHLGAIPSAGIRFRSHRFRPMIYENGRALEQFRFRDESFDLFIQSTLKEVFAFGGGVQLERFFLSESINVLPVEGQRNSFINYYAYVDLDTYDREFKPRKGIRINGMYRVIAERDNFDEFYVPTSILSTRFSQALSLNSRWGVEYWSQGAFTIGSDAAFPYNIFLGGVGENYINYTYSFIGYRFMELVGRNAATVGINLYYEVGKNQFISARGNWGRMEASFGNLFDDGTWLDGYGISYGVSSPLGPIEFTLISSSNHKRVFTYLTLGFWF